MLPLPSAPQADVLLLNYSHHKEPFYQILEFKALKKPLAGLS